MDDRRTAPREPRRGGHDRGRSDERGRRAPRGEHEARPADRPGYASRYRSPYEVDRDYVEGNLGGELAAPYGWGPMDRSTRRPPTAIPPRRGWEGPGSAYSGYDDEAVVFHAEEDAPRPLAGDHRGVGPKGYRRSDERIKEEVCEAMSEHPHLDCSEIEVDVEDGEVILSGQMPDLRIKRLAEDIAWDVRGVDDVFNRIRVRRPD